MADFGVESLLLVSDLDGDGQVELISSKEPVMDVNPGRVHQGLQIWKEQGRENPTWKKAGVALDRLIREFSNPAGTIGGTGRPDGGILVPNTAGGAHPAAQRFL